MDFRQVKTLNIPEGNVIKITDSNGVVIWKKGNNEPDLPTPLANEIYYISTNGKIVQPYNIPTNNTLISNTYKNGIGKMVFKNDLVNLNNYVFSGCTTLQTIVIPQGVSQISGTFKDCISLENVIFPNEGFTYIGNDSFNGCTKLKTIVLPDSLKNIGERAFYDCSNLVNITIPENVKYLGGSRNDNYFQGKGDVFAYCTALKSINIPDSIDLITSDCFYRCTSLKNIIIGSGVTYIQENAFTDCTSLQYIICKARVGPTIDSSTFTNVGKNVSGEKILYVPIGYNYYNSWLEQLKGFKLELITE